MADKKPSQYTVNATGEVGTVVDLPNVEGDGQARWRRLEEVSGGISQQPFKLIVLKLPSGEVKFFDEDALTPA